MQSNSTEKSKFGSNLFFRLQSIKAQRDTKSIGKGDLSKNPPEAKFVA